MAEQYDIFGNCEEPITPKPKNDKEKRNWENAFQRWSESMGEKVYCDECVFLQNREIKVNDEVTGTRFYCSKKKYWFGIGTTLEQIGFNCCAEGEKNET